MRGIWGAFKLACLLAVTGFLLTACSGGGGAAPAPTPSKTISGTAAAGVPIIGTVTIKDSRVPAQMKTVTIEANGHYTVDVTGLLAPYMLRADGYVGGNEYHLYSAGTSADEGGTVNVTPFTDLIVANIAGSIAQTYFNNGNFSGLTAAELTAKSAALRTKLLPVLQVLGVSNSIDLLRAAFNTDHTGLDAALDIFRVSTDPVTQVATITNIITHDTMTSDPVSGSYAGNLDNTTGVAAGVTDIQAITAKFQAFTNLFATSLPRADNPNLLALFDTTFLDSGHNRAAFLSGITTDPGMIGITFTNISILEIDVTNGTAQVVFDVFINGVKNNSAPAKWHMIKKAGIWYLQGDQYIADIDFRSVASYHPSEPQQIKIYSGLHLWIADPGGLGLTSAVVTGHGLPQEGVTFVYDIANQQFQVSGQNSGSDYYMTDAAINQVASTGETYTLRLYKDASLQATYTKTIGKRPYKSTELTPASFPTITAPTLTQLRAFTGGDMTITWTMPTGLINNWVSFGLNDNSGHSAQAGFNTTPELRSKTFTLNPVTATGTTFTPTGRWIYLDGRDSYGGMFSVNIW